MSKYYYLAAQMPLLKFGQQTYITRESFLAEARKWLTDRDFLCLSGADINNFRPCNTDTSFLREYKNFEQTLRQELAILRKGGKLKSDILSEDILSVNPLEAEIKLLQIRWEFIEEKQAGHYFDIDFIVAYFLKIQILERVLTFNKEKGKEVFARLCEVKL
jgi:hypothetical protein